MSHQEPSPQPAAKKPPRTMGGALLRSIGEEKVKSMRSECAAEIREAEERLARAETAIQEYLIALESEPDGPTRKSLVMGILTPVNEKNAAAAHLEKANAHMRDCEDVAIPAYQKTVDDLIAWADELSAEPGEEIA